VAVVPVVLLQVNQVVWMVDPAVVDQEKIIPQVVEILHQHHHHKVIVVVQQVQVVEMVAAEAVPVTPEDLPSMIQTLEMGESVFRF
jgi:hypothetical protein|tara:strand:+ start:57 stop:314 length:258 start_codon:yes stop_codon:yes gene_type:complete